MSETGQSIRPSVLSRVQLGHGLVAAGLWLLRGLARLPGAWRTRMGRLLGRCAGRLLRRRRHIVACNLELCFPERSDAERQHLLEAHFEAAGISLLEMAKAWSGDLDDLEGHLDILGREHFETARQQPEGLLLLGGHYLCMEIAGALFARHWPMDVVYKRQRHPLLDAAERQGRSHHFKELIEPHQIRRAVRRLREGHTVWFAADQDQGGRSAVFAPFFGVPAATLTSPLRLAKITGARVLLLDMWRSDDGQAWTVRFRPPADAGLSGDLDVDARRLNASIEAAVREHPAQYLWLHRRFKTRPPGMPAVY